MAAGLFRQNGTVDLCRRQTIKSFYYRLIAQFKGVVNGLALDHLGGHRAGGNSRAAAKGFKLHILDDAAVYLNVHFHNIAAFGVAHLADAVGVGQLPHVAGVGKMVQNFLGIHMVTILSETKVALSVYARASAAAISSQTGDMARSFSTMGGNVARM